MAVLFPSIELKDISSFTNNLFQVFGPLDFSRRDLMAINLQRARDHGLPDYNTARFAYGLVKLTGFEQINPYYGIDPVSMCTYIRKCM